MMLRTLAILGIAIALALAACGGDSEEVVPGGGGDGNGGGELTLEDYFTRVDGLVGELAANVDDEEFFAEPDDFASVEEQGESLAKTYGDFAENIAVFSDGLADLQPPPAAQAAHEKLLSESKAFTEDSEELVGLLNSATSEADIQEAFELLDSAANPTEACNALQDVAEENDIVVSLSCALDGAAPDATPTPLLGSDRLAGVWEGMIGLVGANEPVPFCLELTGGDGYGVVASVYVQGENEGTMAGFHPSIAAGVPDVHGGSTLDLGTPRGSSLNARFFLGRMVGSWGVVERSPNIGGDFWAERNDASSC